ncbi:FkbM family methyltransferase [Streptomyces sp. IGB124]|uniref:FkbM family methyltransferase n=1 Tax=Streptomyces sp. IGB124 TaxID=1519485 RepID=UPI00099D4609|nr:FkbM family methyltransferase [Streptomyces sp. IGB124]
MPARTSPAQQRSGSSGRCVRDRGVHRQRVLGHLHRCTRGGRPAPYPPLPAGERAGPPERTGARAHRGRSPRQARKGHVDLLKVDIEGSEAEVFSQVQPWMEQVERTVLEVHDKYIDGETVRNTMRAAGFRQVPPRVPEPAGFNPVELYVRS